MKNLNFGLFSKSLIGSSYQLLNSDDDDEERKDFGLRGLRRDLNLYNNKC